MTTQPAQSWTTRQLLDRLQRHYLDPGQTLPGGIFVEEVGWNGNAAGQSRCDAIYVGFTANSGRQLVGHEVKVTRADWRRELDKPGKADQWHDACHAWYVVAPSTDIVPIEELPVGWGLMVPNPRSKVRMQVVVKADRTTHHPPWAAIRSVLARYDTVRAELIHKATVKARDEAVAKAMTDRRITGRPLLTPHDEARLAALDRLEQSLGVTVSEFSFAHGDGIPADQLAAALHLVDRMSKLPKDWEIASAVRNAEHVTRVWHELGEQIKTLRAQMGYPERESA